MKFNSSATYIALFCGSLFLSVSPNCGRKSQPSNSPTPVPTTASPAPATTTATATTTPSPTTPPTTMPPTAVLPTTSATAKLSAPAPPTPSPGTPSKPPICEAYTLNDPEAAGRIKKAIDDSVKDMSFLTKGEAGSRLAKRNLPPPRRLVISCSPTEVHIETDVAGEVRTSADGTPSIWKWDGDTYKVSTRWEGGNLVRTFIGGGGRRVNVYSLSDKGKTLNMHVTITREDWPKLPKPLIYQLVYKRNA